MLAVIETGVVKFTCCQPEVVSFVNVAVASKRTGARPQVSDVSAGVDSLPYRIGCLESSQRRLSGISPRARPGCPDPHLRLRAQLCLAKLWTRHSQLLC